MEKTNARDKGCPNADKEDDPGRDDHKKPKATGSDRHTQKDSQKGGSGVP
jgi:hypothetical protein